jgi:hypothetical protein
VAFACFVIQSVALCDQAIYHTNRIEGNPLSLPEVRAVVETFWSTQDERWPVLHENKARYEPTPA